MLKSGKGDHPHVDLKKIHQSDKGSRESRLLSIRDKESRDEIANLDDLDDDWDDFGDDTITNGDEGLE